ncbi:MAG TPA: GNAT family N-acetyltransferase [Armatimonadota bacterium]|nr:GNAT family N-acetyltransferase [Armatimonadota bacterium]
MNQEMAIRRAGLDDLDLVAPLFDAYRQFYRQSEDLEGARSFMRDRLENRDSVVFLAFCSAGAETAPAGFTQLYPSLSSVSMKPIWILNDLFVAQEFRGRGVGRWLMRAARDFAAEDGAARITLATERGNHRAKALYEAESYILDEVFDHYNLPLNNLPLT